MVQLAHRSKCYFNKQNKRPNVITTTLLHKEQDKNECNIIIGLNRAKVGDKKSPTKRYMYVTVDIKVTLPCFHGHTSYLLHASCICCEYEYFSSVKGVPCHNISATEIKCRHIET